MDIIEKTVKEIKDLKIQGATSVARACLLALQKLKIKNKKLKTEELKRAVEELGTARPTEPLARNCLYYVLWQVEKGQELTKSVDLMLNKLSDIKNEIVRNGVGLIKDGMVILTHCHSSSAVEIFKEAKKRGREFQVFLTETRPKYQGRIAAKKLIEAKIPATLIVDSAAAFLISKEDKVPINLVLLGCDAVLPEKGVLNKIGSYGLALSAYKAKIPLFIAGSLLKTSKQILKIEERKGEEIWKKKPRDLKILNLAFDLIPMEFIAGIITEFGSVKPEKVRGLVKKHYSFISL